MIFVPVAENIEALNKYPHFFSNTFYFSNFGIFSKFIVLKVWIMSLKEQSILPGIFTDSGSATAWK